MQYLPNKAEDFSKKPKCYILVEFPYPSGEGLHVGHIRSYVAFDILAKKRQMEGYNVLYPIGWDAFGLPAENYALKTGIHPKITVKENIVNFKKQLKSLGLSFDWSREINTTDPDYYKWTQWIFLQFFKKGLAFQAKIPINWCPSCKIGLANEEVAEGRCERCGTPVERKVRKQWMLKITTYADRLIDDLKKVDYSEKIKAQQINWIGRSYGTEVDFPLESYPNKIQVFTTRIDTIYGVRAMVLAPEHPLIQKIVKKEFQKKVKEYIKKSLEKTEFERSQLEKERTGVFTGSFCKNPLNLERIPIWVGDYVIGAYGGGAVMVVPAHDKRDYQFAKKNNLEIREVISGGDITKEAFVAYGTLINSGPFKGLDSKTAIEKITKHLEKEKLGRKKVQYKLRDWVFSRQHYWGEPIPLIHCPKCGVVPVAEKDLPVKLPYVKKYQPTKTGESPLAGISRWVSTKCPKCGKTARRETDTMPNWAGSSWYFIRYCDPNNKQSLASFKKMKYWLPVDWYNGGMEHTTLHLLYSRFWYKFLFDIGIVPQDEPYLKRTSHGVILGEDGRKMSKSLANIINPDEIVRTYGADTLRVYEMFMGPFDQTISWSNQGVKGAFKFLERTFQFIEECFKNKKSSQKAIKLVHKLNRKIDKDIEKTKFNTSIAAFMKFVNFGLKNKKGIGQDVIKRFLLLFAPFAPHICEELWSKIYPQKYKKKGYSVFKEKWPKYDLKFIEEEKIELIIQVNAKFRDKIETNSDISQKEAENKARKREKIKKWLGNKKIKKVIFVPKKLINFVID